MKPNNPSSFEYPTPTPCPNCQNIPPKWLLFLTRLLAPNSTLIHHRCQEPTDATREATPKPTDATREATPKPTDATREATPKPADASREASPESVGASREALTESRDGGRICEY